MIDLHSHILPGLDDGAQTLSDSRELARRAAAEGVTAIAATPHVRDDYPTSAEQMERGVEDLRTDFDRNGIPVQVLHGGEIDFEMLLGIEREELVRFTLAQNGRYVLVESPYFGWPLGLGRALSELSLTGLTAILAHPERNREVQARPELLAELVATGTLVQVTAASLDGRLGRSTKAAAEKLLELDLVHLLASDAHTPDIREAGLLSAARAIGDDRVAHYLTEASPAAIVAGEPLPERPQGKRKRRLLPF